MLMKFRYIIEYAFLRAMVLFLSLFPYRAGQWISGRLLGSLAYHLGGSIRRKVRSNLQFAFPEMSAGKRESIAQVAYRYLGQLVFEFVHFINVKESWLSRYVEIEPSTLEALRLARDEGKGIILVAAHFGSWEIFNRALISALNLDFHVYAAPQSNPYANRFVFRTREKTGMHLILPTTSGHKTVRLLRKGATVGMVADQNARSNGVFIPFLNRPASTFLGPGIFAYHSGSPAFFIAGIRLPGGKFRIEALPLGVVDKEKETDVDSAAVAFTLKWTDILEKYVRLYPEQYFWFHNRWKTKPGADAIIYKRVDAGISPIPHKG